MRRIRTLQRINVALSRGAIVLGLAYSVDRIPFSDIFTSFLAQLFSVLITLLFGGTVDTTLV